MSNVMGSHLNIRHFISLRSWDFINKTFLEEMSNVEMRPLLFFFVSKDDIKYV
jgi:hypothetical protein